jgi:hypothetical protein
VGAPPLRAPVRHAWSRCGEGTIDALSTDSRAEAHLHHWARAGSRAGATACRPFIIVRVLLAGRQQAFAPVRKVQEIENRPTVRTILDNIDISVT